MNTDFKVAEIALSYKNNIPYNERAKVSGSMDAFNILHDTHDDGTIDYTETFRVLYLNQSNQVLGCNTISKGGLTNTSVDVRTILQGALLTNAVAIILGHNHPSGNTRPSRDDEMVTQQIVKAAHMLDIRVLDHIIYTRENYYSFTDEGKI
ncbi:MAG: JAB domain-containing protein [Bacteroidales bacterium]|nr:JAB domain-containing protein [Bacteroidales bacterium]